MYHIPTTASIINKFEKQKQIEQTKVCIGKTKCDRCEKDITHSYKNKGTTYCQMCRWLYWLYCI